MSNKQNKDSLFDTSPVISQKVPPGVDGRSFLMRSAVVGAAAVMTGKVVSARSRTLKAFSESLPLQAQGPTPPLSADLAVVKQGKGPVLTVLDEFYKVGPGRARTDFQISINRVRRTLRCTIPMACLPSRLERLRRA